MKNKAKDYTFNALYHTAMQRDGIIGEERDA